MRPVWTDDKARKDSFVLWPDDFLVNRPYRLRSPCLIIEKATAGGGYNEELL